MYMEFDLRKYTQLLQSCNTHNSIFGIKQLHGLFLKRGIFNSVIVIGNRLLQLYGKFGYMGDASKVFDEMSHRNCFSWNTLIEGYMKLGNRDKALDVFYSMPVKNDFSWNVVVSVCVKSGDLSLGRMLFNQMPRKNGIVWNCMIHGYVRRGYPREALRLFKELTFEDGEVGWRDPFVLASVIGACSDLMDLECGKQVHARIVIDNVEVDSVMESSLVNLYSKCGDLDKANYVIRLMKEPDDYSLSALITGYANVSRMTDARIFFDSIANPCVVVWNSLISGYITNNEGKEALVVFNMMRNRYFKPDFSTLSSVLTACSSSADLMYGKKLHSLVFKYGTSMDVVIACSLIDMYSKCGIPDDACKIFSELEFYDTVLLNSMISVYSNCGRVKEAEQIFRSVGHKTLISWNSMLAGFTQNGCPLPALYLFCEMNKLGFRMDKFSYASVICACAGITSLELGEQVFARTIVLGLESDLIVCTSLIDLYCKCSFVNLGQKLFDDMVKSDEVSWNSMLTGYATNGYGLEVLNLFANMRNAGVQPNHITFTVVLSACSHCGLIDEARKWFHVMQSDYHLAPGYDHYSCMVDLLARAGSLEQAMGLIKQMPFKADVTIWSSVLRGCVAHGNKDLGKEIAEMIIYVDPENSNAYVQLSGMFATSGDWEGSTQVRDIMRAKSVEKYPAISW